MTKKEIKLAIKEGRVCKNCKFFHSYYQSIVAPINMINADGLCLISPEQPIILDSKTDTCVNFCIK